MAKETPEEKKAREDREANETPAQRKERLANETPDEKAAREAREGGVTD